MTKADKILASLDGFDAARFWVKVRVRADGCWEWMGATNRNGYGVFACRGRMLRAPRVAFTLSRGHPPKRLVLHECDNPECVRPWCLSDGSNQQNMADARSRGRPLGTRKRVLEDKQVETIRQLLGEGRLSNRAIANRFNVSPSLITHIKKGRVHNTRGER